MTDTRLNLFVRESNWIEGIKRDPLPVEIAAHIMILGAGAITIPVLQQFVSMVEPDAVLRDQPGLNVRVGDHHPPPGGPTIADDLQRILTLVRTSTPYFIHQEYETLHPFTDGNGRSGRALWLATMGGLKHAPLGFLHHFYYQSLSAYRP